MRWDRHHSLLLGLVIPTRQSCWGFLSAHKHFGCFSKLPTSVQQWLPFLPAHETAFSEVTPQIRFLDKQRSVFCPLCNTPPSVFFSVGIYYKHLHKDMSQLGKGLLLLGCVRLLSNSQNTEQTLPEKGAWAFICCSNIHCYLLILPCLLQLSCLLLPLTSNTAELETLLSTTAKWLNKS